MINVLQDLCGSSKADKLETHWECVEYWKDSSFSGERNQSWFLNHHISGAQFSYSLDERSHFKWHLTHAKLVFDKGTVFTCCIWSNISLVFLDPGTLRTHISSRDLTWDHTSLTLGISCVTNPTYPRVQCAAVRTHLGLIKVPPQNCLLNMFEDRPLANATCQGASPGFALWPPIILVKLPLLFMSPSLPRELAHGEQTRGKCLVILTNSYSYQHVRV